MMPLQLRDNLHWCNCGGRAVFLDTERDRYFCLSQAANDAFLRLAAGDTRARDSDRLNVLVAHGMLVQAGVYEPLRGPASIEPPSRDFLEQPFERAGLIPIIRALAWELRSVWALKTMPFHEVIEAVRRRDGAECKSPKKPNATVTQIVSASSAASFIARSHDRCLVRALAVHAMCRRSGLSPKLVFGVIAHPFTAHCWVQLGSAVLVGAHEQARLYTPILVLE